MLLLNRGDRIRTCDLVLPKGQVIQRKYWKSLLAYRIWAGLGWLVTATIGTDRRAIARKLHGLMYVDLVLPQCHDLLRLGQVIP